ncbi:unnamed protein product, partial [marine sediment metagenome]
MSTINFNNDENKGTWFNFIEGDKSEKPCRIRLKVASLEELEQIDRITVKTSKKFKRGVAYDDVKKNEPLARKLLWD